MKWRLLSISLTHTHFTLYLSHTHTFYSLSLSHTHILLSISLTHTHFTLYLSHTHTHTHILLCPTFTFEVSRMKGSEFESRHFFSSCPLQIHSHLLITHTYTLSLSLSLFHELIQDHRNWKFSKNSITNFKSKLCFHSFKIDYFDVTLKALRHSHLVRNWLHP